MNEEEVQCQPKIGKEYFKCGLLPDRYRCKGKLEPIMACWSDEVMGFEILKTGFGNWILGFEIYLKFDACNL